MSATRKTTQSASSEVRVMIEGLSSASRRDRQTAADLVEKAARADATQLIPVVGELVEALQCQEPRTRRDVLAALKEIATIDASVCDGALDGAEASMFDESNGAARLAAFKFMAVYGASSAERSAKVWLVMGEALMCYHGDPEFMDMMNATLKFSEGDIDPKVAEALIQRLSFDAENARGTLKNKAQQIIDNAKRIG